MGCAEAVEFPLGAVGGGEPGLGGPARGRPVVRLGVQPRELVAGVWRVLEEANVPPWLFCQHGMLVMIARSSNLRSGLVKPVDRDGFFACLIAIADWVDAKGRAARPPEFLVRVMLARPSPSLPELETVVTVPTFGKSLEFISREGYFLDERVYYRNAAGLEVQPVRRRPSRADVAAGYALDSVIQTCSDGARHTETNLFTPASPSSRHGLRKAVWIGQARLSALSSHGRTCWAESWMWQA